MMDHAQEQGLWTAIGRVEADADALRQELEQIAKIRPTSEPALPVWRKVVLCFVLGIGKLAFWIVMWWWIAFVASATVSGLHGTQSASCQIAGGV